MPLPWTLDKKQADMLLHSAYTCDPICKGRGPTVREFGALFDRLSCLGSDGTVAGVENLTAAELGRFSTSMLDPSGIVNVHSSLKEYDLPGLRPLTCHQETVKVRVLLQQSEQDAYEVYL